ncbi:hypothetical protein T4E_12326 [Trichinella pseudospiralis]|uniref:Uncharacterized protein n=1 Tax=Trichinella pseudospiralis TaxID=6337 RepID=A0A0V0XT41_TRIPS|nr:hypothetical protein T4E_12326 [Trichinella pseudospiralis]
MDTCRILATSTPTALRNQLGWMLIFDVQLENHKKSKNAIKYSKSHTPVKVTDSVPSNYPPSDLMENVKITVFSAKRKKKKKKEEEEEEEEEEYGKFAK